MTRIVKQRMNEQLSTNLVNLELSNHSQTNALENSEYSTPACQSYSEQLTPNSNTHKFEHSAHDCQCSPHADKMSVFYQLAERSQDAIVITDAKRRILYVNPTFEQRSGYVFSDVKGRNPNIFKSEKNPPGVYRELYRSLTAHGEWFGPLVQQHRDGGEYIEHVQITSLCDEHGQVSFYLAQKALVAEEEHIKEHVYKLTHFDTLTELPNRRYLLKVANQLCQSYSTSSDSFGILFLDLNDFKNINDSSGHLAGDHVLQQIGLRLANQLNDQDIIARIGGDEFAILHCQATNDSMRALALKLSECFIEPVYFNEHPLQASVSIGGAVWPTDGKKLKSILANADLAMFQAKQRRQPFVAYNAEMGERFAREQHIHHALHSGLANNEFFLVYQPKYRLSDQSLIGMEVLLRWESSELGSIGPDEFISIAERHHLMCNIGEWVFDQTCQQIALWQKDGIALPGRVAVNISVQQLEHSEFINDMARVLSKYNLDAYHFELEVTESMLIRDPDQAMQTLDALRDLGFTIAVDDFGTGFSSFSYLRRIRANCIKIDKSFIADLTSTIQDALIVRSVVNLAHSLNMTVVSEGIETNDQLSQLVEMGCDSGQGYLLARPLPAHDMMYTLLTSSHT